MTIRVVFFGSPDFAVPSLHALARDARFDVALVVTQPDRPAGRGRKLRSPAVKTAAGELGIPVWQPVTLRDASAVERLRAIGADLFVVAAYGEILRRVVLEMPPCGVLNVHPSLLPRYRGSSPIQAAILHGDVETGVSIIRLVRRLDAGPIVAQQALPLAGTETAGELSRRLAGLAGAILPGVAAAWVARAIAARPQDDAAATYTREITPADGQIDWRASAVAIERLVRAMSPWPRAWTLLTERRLVVSACDISQWISATPPGTIERAADGILVSTGTTAVRLLRVQPAGKREMDARDWFRGARVAEGERFEPRAGRNRSGESDAETADAARPA